MRRAWLLFTLLISTLLSAQSTLLIEDETFKGVKLVVDGFIQNARPTNKLAISNFPLEKVTVKILLGDEETITRKINLPDNGIHRYIIMRNFAGTLQLRYRGKEASVPPEYTRENYNKLLAYASEPPPATAPKIEVAKVPEEKIATVDQPTENKVVAAANEKKPEQKPAERITIAEEPKTESKPKVIPAKAEKPRITIAQDSPALVKMNETFTIEEPTDKKDEANFEHLFAKLKAEEFEFDKLRVAKEKLAKIELNAEQVVEILRQFRYDQTRFQFLEEAVKNNPSLRHSADLFKPEFEYILSRSKVVEILEANE